METKIDLSKYKVLRLTLKKKPFDLKLRREKGEEYRKPGKWIKSRLMDKQGKQRKYDYIIFTNGYGANVPYLICKSGGWSYAYLRENEEREITYSNGLKVKVEAGDFVIKLGKIVETGNLKKELK